MAGDDGIDVDGILGRIEESYHNRLLHSDLKRLMKDGPEAYIAAKKGKKNNSSPVLVLQPSPSTLTNIETLLSSKLVELSLLETQRVRKETYTIFKDNARDYDRWSFLFDEIPFKLSTQCQRNKLIGAYDVYYHDDKIDWGALEGWSVPSTVKNCDEGLIIIDRAEGRNNTLEGRLIFIPDSDNDEYYSEKKESYATNIEINEENSDVNEGEDLISERAESNYDAEERNVENPSDDADNGEKSDDISLTESEKRMTLEKEIAGKFLGEYTFLHFDEQTFNLDQDYKNASWFASGSDVEFGLTKYPLDDDNDENMNSVTIFRADENMAFAKGRMQQFVSLDNAFNAGLDGSIHGRRDDDEIETHRVNVIEKMQVYRGSWISNLCPSDMNLPEGVAHLIWEYWQEGPSPFLFVHKGDLLLLARHDLHLPDPDPEVPVIVTVTREHLVLARPQRI